jgi:hypothetical protein
VVHCGCGCHRAGAVQSILSPVAGGGGK